MTDPLAAGVEAIARGNATFLPLVVFAGMVTSLGPCVAPRYIAIAALVGEGRRSLTIAAFVAGIVTAYTALGFGAGLLTEITGHASALYVVLALALACGGVATLLRGSGCARSHHDDPKMKQASRPSAAFSLGAASALVVSPCCTPVVAAVVGMAADANPLSRAALLGAFALGHAAPLFAFGSLGSVCARTFRRWNASPAPAIVSGSLMLALAAYYGLLV